MNQISFLGPIRPTRARDLRAGDEILFPSDVVPGAVLRAVITDLMENEEDRTITINGELIGEEALFSHEAPPLELVDRVVQAGESRPDGRTVIVRGDELWKWIGEKFNDPHGSTEKFVIGAFDRCVNPDTGEPMVEVKLHSLSNRRKIVTAGLEPSATIIFAETR
ncbi:putative protein OS=Tsukamurella paurometabola (strain ATCC 8368 / DSM / CCUG 35730 /CIP 100753 / JCM 10117 / KCTC 9821 / NBRC 16120 / NCIMB 702349/ NCTC 13040) OX=521096 GN=Tpau_2481 PE=4 SV=1 [Tsukamurella paurometabola]|uniref:Uncharacterized protein n=1 Tax=Tsukamurella paurometabola (strain ATCC 8368 / DSM 20162 / CCUG 35730 / CIP 100753 / JCM 10117 / KCTC 9821 / NBRC 16120 / NCIMB 702349 / NCTC 13040) TaxID=521096 RepID=D5UR96_TSUPD|nr:hypothetical protein [Tsukamurella paurometabola]ADG79085.1 hypothetical protein Tpau_2481 [Tsukamurella paurometabola DSM 20162]SUP34024.1 Uncharacterised protein [Tsukamurella paurometabola]